MNIPEKQRTMDIDTLFKAFRKCRIAVIGDLMLDKYIFGHVSRISPEYPVPVVDVTKQEFRLGGAANVAVNTRAMGAETILIGVTGADADATSLRKLLEDGGISPEDIVTDESRPTTSKTRILSQNHHITRVDHEKRTPVDEHIEEEIIGKVNKELDSLDAIILEDYNKGVLTPGLQVRLFHWPGNTISRYLWILSSRASSITRAALCSNRTFRKLPPPWELCSPTTAKR